MLSTHIYVYIFCMQIYVWISLYSHYCLKLNIFIHSNLSKKNCKYLEWACLLKMEWAHSIICHSNRKSSSIGLGITNVISQENYTWKKKSKYILCEPNIRRNTHKCKLSMVYNQVYHVQRGNDTYNNTGIWLSWWYILKYRT